MSSLNNMLLTVVLVVVVGIIGGNVVSGLLNVVGQMEVAKYHAN